ACSGRPSLRYSSYSPVYSRTESDTSILLLVCRSRIVAYRHGSLPLLRASRERPTGRRAAEQCDELAAFHSITSSARASSVGGTRRPRVLAVLRLMISSNFVGCWTGRSAGLSPARIRPT